MSAAWKTPRGARPNRGEGLARPEVLRKRDHDSRVGRPEEWSPPDAFDRGQNPAYRLTRHFSFPPVALPAAFVLELGTTARRGHRRARRGTCEAGRPWRPPTRA